MNWQQIVFNLLGSFAAGFGTALASGSTPKVAVGVGSGAVAAVIAGLFQTAPHQQ